MWDPPRSGIKSASPALAGGLFSSTVSPGKSYLLLLFVTYFPVSLPSLCWVLHIRRESSLPVFTEGSCAREDTQSSQPEMWAISQTFVLLPKQSLVFSSPMASRVWEVPLVLGDRQDRDQSLEQQQRTLWFWQCSPTPLILRGKACIWSLSLFALHCTGQGACAPKILATAALLPVASRAWHLSGPLVLRDRQARSQILG